jgi:hypothetical protein
MYKLNDEHIYTTRNAGIRGRKRKIGIAIGALGMYFLGFCDPVGRTRDF